MALKYAAAGREGARIQGMPQTDISRIVIAGAGPAGAICGPAASQHGHVVIASEAAGGGKPAHPSAGRTSSVTAWRL